MTSTSEPEKVRARCEVRHKYVSDNHVCSHLQGASWVQEPTRTPKTPVHMPGSGVQVAPRTSYIGIGERCEVKQNPPRRPAKGRRAQRYR
jgi:hypothetical protein